MRAKGRIDIVLKFMSDDIARLKFLEDHLTDESYNELDLFLEERVRALQKLSENVGEVIKNKIFINNWKEYPDLRFGQLLINERIVPDIMKMWAVEECDWIARTYPKWASKVLFWGSFGKNKDRPYIQKPIIKMSTTHLKACLETQDQMHPLYRKIMEEEVKKRKNKKR